MRRAMIAVGWLLLGCNPPGVASEAPRAPETPRFAAQPSSEARATAMEVAPPPQPASTAPEAPDPARAGPGLVAGSDARDPVASADVDPELQTLPDAIALLERAGYEQLATVIAARVAQTTPKMKLDAEQGLRLAQNVYEALPSMPETRALSRTMPKAALELVRSTYERSVTTAEAERMARYLSHLVDHLRPKNLAALDENCSHVVGREWRDIDYSGEGLSWERQQRIYSIKGVPNFKEAATLERFFRVESQAPYFNRIYRPDGAVP